MVKFRKSLRNQAVGIRQRPFAEMFDELGIDYAYGKLREKMNRIKVLRKQPNMVENEGLEDALLDTAGYAILALVELKKRNNGRD